MGICIRRAGLAIVMYWSPVSCNIIVNSFLPAQLCDNIVTSVCEKFCSKIFKDNGSNHLIDVFKNALDFLVFLPHVCRLLQASLFLCGIFHFGAGWICFLYFLTVWANFYNDVFENGLFRERESSSSSGGGGGQEVVG